MKRGLLTALAVGIVAGLIIIIGVGQNVEAPDTGRPATTAANQTTAEANVPAPAPIESTAPAAPQPTAPAQPEPVAAPNVAAPNPPQPATTPAAAADHPAGNFRIVPVDTQPEPVIGSTDPDESNPYMMAVRFTPWNAGIIDIQLSRYSTKVGEHVPYPLGERLVSGRTADGKPIYSYPMGSRAIEIDGQRIDLSYARWTVTGADEQGGRASFELTLRDANDANAGVKLYRTYTLEPGSYDLKLEQRIVNRTGGKLDIQFTQFGQGDLPVEGGYLGDRRSVVMGYFRPDYDPGRRVYIEHFNIARRELLEEDNANLWPAAEPPLEERLDLAFAAMTNRYFMTALHRPAVVAQPGADPNKPYVAELDDLFPYVQFQRLGQGDQAQFVYLMHTPRFALDAGASQQLDLALFAGPKDPDLVEDTPLYSALGLDKLIIYNIGGCCSWLTFSWLSHGLLAFLKLLHAGLADWGLAIIILVIVVRAILHPITKRSQINMMKFGRQMQTLQPEMERLKRKYKDNQQKLNQEMMKLYKDKGVNPAAMGMGCLPMFLQMPIWIALYAMLFFAIELRHEPAFYNVFHNLGAMMGFDWAFLRDLSAPDHFITLPESIAFTVPLVGMEIASLNIIPILMAFVFLIQQKFMRPPTQGEISEQAAQQQKMMKFMTLLFPLFLYNAPAGLTLYILASTGSGILDSYLVRKHIKEQEAEGRPITEPKKRREGGFMDRMKKAAEAKRAEVENQQRRLEGNPQQSRRRKK